jgi:hypothetical protein
MQLRSGTVLKANNANVPTTPQHVKCKVCNATSCANFNPGQRIARSNDFAVKAQFVTQCKELLDKIKTAKSPAERLKKIVDLWKYMLSIQDRLRLLSPTDSLIDAIFNKTVELSADVMERYKEGKFETADAKKDLAEFVILNAKVMIMTNNIKKGVGVA